MKLIVQLDSGEIFETQARSSESLAAVRCSFDILLSAPARFLMAVWCSMGQASLQTLCLSREVAHW